MTKIFSLMDFIEDEVRPNAHKIDSDPTIVKDYLKKLVLGISNVVDFKSELIKNSEYEALFGASTALAFIFAQHLATLERLQGNPEWIQKNPSLWTALTRGEKMCGLATTHLAKPNGAGIIGTKTENGFLVSGEASWVCGYGIFDYLLLGFEAGDYVHFAITEFPFNNDHVVHSIQDMVCLNGTATATLVFKNFFVKTSEAVSFRKKDAKSTPRKTTYIIPELGIGKTALRETFRLIKDSTHPKHILVSKGLEGLEKRLYDIEEIKKAGENTDQLIQLKDDFNRDAIRLLAITMGAASLKKNSLPSRLQMETFLFDSVIQSPGTLSKKINSLGEPHRS